MQFKAQLRSCSSANLKSALKVVSIHKNVINFKVNDGQLLCLHQRGSGLSPMGWQIKENDFVQIKQLMKLNQSLEFDGKYLKHHAFIIQMASKIISLQLPAVSFSKQNNLNIIAQLDKKTGLYGSLNYAVSNLERAEFQPYFAFIEQIMMQKTQISIIHLLGKGLGLTPSSDDTLIGILAVLYSQPKIKKYLQQVKPFQNYYLLALSEHTTLVSANYVFQALQGNFATFLWHFIANFNQLGNFFNRLRAVLNCGHCSGADTLLGIFLAVKWMQA